MAFDSTINFNSYIIRGVEILKANEKLRNPTTPGDSLVTDILAQEPPIDQSPNKAIIPVIFVAQSKNPINRTEVIGKDSLDVIGARYYHIEFYNVIIARGIDRQEAQKKCHEIGQIVRDAYQKNMRMIDTHGANPICDINEVVEIPFVLKSNTTDIQALNVICRPKVPISLR